MPPKPSNASWTKFFAARRSSTQYLDSILVASKNLDEHLYHLREVFSRLQDHGIQINASKSVLGGASLEFLGHQVDQQASVLWQPKSK